MKKVISLLLVLVMVLSLAACAGGNAKTEAETGYDVVKVDAENKSISFKAQVNGKYFSDPTRHGVVFKDGKNGEKSILRGLASEKDVYACLLGLGGKPGDNVPMPAPDGTIVEGSKVNITVSWEGSNGEIPFGDIVKTGNGKPYVMDARFGGNVQRACTVFTGCIFCLDSCPVGITSNAAYGFGVVENTKTEQFYGNPDVLPADGTIVTVTMTLAE